MLLFLISISEKRQDPLFGVFPDQVSTGLQDPSQKLRMLIRQSDEIYLNAYGVAAKSAGLSSICF